MESKTTEKRKSEDPPAVLPKQKRSRNSRSADMKPPLVEVEICDDDDDDEASAVEATEVVGSDEDDGDGDVPNDHYGDGSGNSNDDDNDNDDDDDNGEDLLSYKDLDSRIKDAEYSWILKLSLNQLKKECYPFLINDKIPVDSFKTKEGHQKCLFHQYVFYHSKNRRSMMTRATSCNRVKDDCVSRKFEVSMNHMKDLHHCSTYPPGFEGKLPSLLSIVLVHDQMISRPDLRKANMSHKAREEPRTSLFVPKGTDEIEVADILENAARNIRASCAWKREASPKTKSVLVTSKVDELYRSVFDKKFVPKNQNPEHKQRKQK